MVVGHVLLQLGGDLRASVPALIAHSGPFAKAILVILLGMSVYSWAVLWNRLRLYNRVAKADQRFLASFRQLRPEMDCRLMCEQHPSSLLARVALAGQRSLEQEHAVGSHTTRHEISQRAMDRAANEETASLERHVGFLATTGSVAPFIGLMGTVWGVMTSFLNIGSQGSASLVVVAPGIAEALIATIAGLVAAIPAVVGYNHLVGRLREFGHATSQFATEFLDRRAGVVGNVRTGITA
jgi:biopolymer transport protein TolQ